MFQTESGDSFKPTLHPVEGHQGPREHAENDLILTFVSFSIALLTLYMCKAVLTKRLE